jgi:hypothetical protein
MVGSSGNQGRESIGNQDVSLSFGGSLLGWRKTLVRSVMNTSPETSLRFLKAARPGAGWMRGASPDQRRSQAHLSPQTEARTSSMLVVGLFQVVHSCIFWGDSLPIELLIGTASTWSYFMMHGLGMECSLAACFTGSHACEPEFAVPMEEPRGILHVPNWSSTSCALRDPGCTACWQYIPTQKILMRNGVVNMNLLYCTVLIRALIFSAPLLGSHARGVY